MIKTYLDFNIFIDLIHARNTINLAKYLKTNNIQYYYSPAHLEEIAHANFTYSKESLQDYFDIISSITNNMEIRPLRILCPLSPYNEHPQNVFNRVIDNDGLLITKQVENADHITFYKWQELRKINKITLDSKILNNISPKNIFSDEIFDSNLVNIFDEIFYPFKFYNLKQSYNILSLLPYFYLEASIEALLKILQFIGYHSDKERTFRSATHDISHGHYATMCKIFVTNDKKYSYRIEAVYNFLGVPTKIMNFRTYFNEILS